jgi:hypothetical protein
VGILEVNAHEGKLNGPLMLKDKYPEVASSRPLLCSSSSQLTRFSPISTLGLFNNGCPHPLREAERWPYHPCGTCENPGYFIPRIVWLTHKYLSQLAYGTGTAWFKPADKRNSIDRTLVSSIKSAIKLGYHHLDSAEVYGTEPELGIAIKESRVPRERLFVTTKIIDSSIRDIPGTLDASLKKLGLDYVDLYVSLRFLQ